AALVTSPPKDMAEGAAKTEIVRLSTTYRVLSPYTSLLVLETENDYARYKIDRKALADILTVEGTRLARRKRGADLVFGAPTGPPHREPRGAGAVLPPPPLPPPGGAREPNRAAALRDSQEFGMVGVLNSGASGDPNAPPAPWGRDDSLGNDPLA